MSTPKTPQDEKSEFELLSFSFVDVDSLVTPHPVGRILCLQCKGKGAVPLFTSFVECETCEGSGWMGGPRRVKVPVKKPVPFVEINFKLSGLQEAAYHAASRIVVPPSLRSSSPTEEDQGDKE